MADGGADVVHLDSTTDEYQYRCLCLQMANSAQELAEDMRVEKVIDRATRYWEFICGGNPEEILKAVREAMAETQGNA